MQIFFGQVLKLHFDTGTLFNTDPHYQVVKPVTPEGPYYVSSTRAYSYIPKQKSQINHNTKTPAATQESWGFVLGPWGKMVS